MNWADNMEEDNREEDDWVVNLRLLKRCERNKVERQKVASFLKNGV